MPSSAQRPQQRLQPVGEGGSAIERHAQAIVEFAEVGVLDELMPVMGRIEPADRQARPKITKDYDAHECRRRSLGREQPVLP